MTLRLRVISEHRHLVDLDTVTFGVGGGSIGRSADNDWVLPDPRRYVSAHHARVHFRDGHYYLEDISTNGVYVNDAAEPLSKRGSEGHLLRQGDVLRLGEYHIEVSFEGAFPGESAVLPSRIMALQALGAVQTDIGAVLDLDDLLAVDPPPGLSAPPLEPPSIEQLPGDLPPAPPHANPKPEPADDTVARRMARLARAAGREAREAELGSSGPSHDAALQAFCRGAGLKPADLPAQTQGLLHLAGRLLREALVGMKDVERSQEQVRNRLGVRMPPAEPDTGPALGRSTVEDLLLGLIHQHEEHSLDAVRWMRERHDELKAREQALGQALRAAFLEFLGRLDPAELEARFARSARESAPPRYWELFSAFYRSLLGPPDQLPHSFVEAFAQAYKEALQPNTHDMPGGARPEGSSGRRR